MSPEPQKSSKTPMDRLMLEAVLDGDPQAWQTTAASIEGTHAFRVLTTATSVAIFRRWPTDPPIQEVADYVAGMAAKIPGRLPVAPAVVEALIRGTLGEEELLEGLPGKEVVVAALLIIQSIQREILRTPAEREAYLSETLAAVD